MAIPIVAGVNQRPMARQTSESPRPYKCEEGAEKLAETTLLRTCFAHDLASGWRLTRVSHLAFVLCDETPSGDYPKKDAT